MSNNIQQYGSNGGSGFDFTKLILGLAVAYFLNPVDIPGPLDDMGVIVTALVVVGIMSLFGMGGGR